MDAVRVTMIQYLLRQHGCPVTVDGKYGLQTQQQVIRFQRSRHLKITGVVGGPTWRALILSLHRGQQGGAVLAAQVALSQWVDDRLPLDGKFGQRTERAVRIFQKRNGLPQDGIIGSATWMHLTDTYGD